MIESPYKLPKITPPKEHPRLMLRLADIPRIKGNMTLPENARALELWQFLCKREPSYEGGPHGSYNLHDCLTVEARALKALLNEDYNEAKLVFSYLKRILDGAEFVKGIMHARYCGHMLFIAAEVYDWCYCYLTDAEKEYIITRCEELASTFEMGYPPRGQGAISGHGSEAQLLRDLLSFSIAIYDERPDVYNFCAGRIFEQYVPEYAVFFSSGFHTQGPTYGAYRQTSALWSAMIFLSMCGERIYHPCFDDFCDHFLYMTRPDGQCIRLGDDCTELKADYLRDHPFLVPMFFAAAYTGNKRYYDYFRANGHDEFLIPSQTALDYYEHGSYGEGLFSPTVQLIWYGYTPEAMKSEYPICRHFGAHVGATVYNDGERVVFLKGGELWGANHDHLDTGCFQIYYKGTLASDSGAYDNYCTPHRYNYLIQTHAHNCLTVTDPSLPLDGREEDLPYYGGTHKPIKGREPSYCGFWQENYRMARVLSHSESDSGCELHVDMSPAYRDTCISAVRHMVFEADRGAHGVLTVTDEVTARNPESVKAFNLHCLREPSLEGDALTIYGEGSKLVCRVLSPEDYDIELIGGRDRECSTGDVNYPSNPDPKAESGWGRIVITPKERRATDRITVEMEILDA